MNEQKKTETLVSVDDLIGESSWVHIGPDGLDEVFCGHTLPPGKHFEDGPPPSGSERLCPDCARIARERGMMR